MSITDELREWAKIYWTYPHENAAYVTAIADRIDILHKQAVDKAHADGERNALQQHRSASEDYRRGYEKGMADGLDVGFADALAEHGWVKLPVDADGVPIRVGDKVTEHEDGHTFTVDGYDYSSDDGRVWVFESQGLQAPADRCTHHAQTVEDVLTELEGMRGGYATYEDVVMRCAELTKTLRELLQLKEADE